MLPSPSFPLQPTVCKTFTLYVLQTIELQMVIGTLITRDLPPETMVCRDQREKRGVGPLHFNSPPSAVYRHPYRSSLRMMSVALSRTFM
jgi:hypothetical protein